MSTIAPLPAGSAQRQRVMRALGLTPWVLRGHGPVAAAASPAMAPDLVAAQAVHCVVVLPAGCAPRELDLLGRALCAFGPALARAARIEVGAGRLAELPVARAYLAFGETQAHALGRELPAELQQRAQIVLADAPDRVLVDAAGKRRLWNALRHLRRALLEAGD